MSDTKSIWQGLTKTLTPIAALMCLVLAKSIGQLCKNVNATACEDQSAAQQCLLQLQAIYIQRRGWDTALWPSTDLYDATNNPKATTTFLSGSFTTGWITARHSLLISYSNSGSCLQPWEVASLGAFPTREILCMFVTFLWRDEEPAQHGRRRTDRVFWQQQAP